MTFKLQVMKDNIQIVERAKKMDKRDVLRNVQIEPEHLKEKNNWYRILNTVQYFKKRDDCRVIGELLSCAIANQFSLETASYEIAFLKGRLTLPALGLLSPNVQSKEFTYYDVTTLHRLFPELPRKYSEYSLKELLDSFRYNQVPGCEQLIKDIITVYVLDWFTHQLDRNPKNLLFKRDQQQVISLSPLIDSESSFAVNHEGNFDEEYNPIWVPAIPYDDLDFRDNPYQIEDLDANIVSLIMDYPEIVIPVLKQLSDTNFDALITEYQKTMNSKVYIEKEGIDFLKQFVYRKQETSQRMLQF